MNGLIKKILLIAKNVTVILTLVTVLSTCSDDVDYLLEPMSVGYANLYTKNGSFENDIPNIIREDDTIGVFLQSRALLASDIGVKVLFKFKRFDGQRTFTFEAGDAFFQDLGGLESVVKSATLTIQMKGNDRVKGSYRMLSNRSGDEFESWGDFEGSIRFQKETFQDQDGNNFSAVKIGDQWWMQSNLEAMHFRNGDTISQVHTDTGWSAAKTPTLWTHPQNKEVFYNFEVVNDERNIAPEGWHVATTADFQTLEIFLGATLEETNQYEGWIGIQNEIAQIMTSNVDGLKGGDFHEFSFMVFAAEEFGFLSETGVFDTEGAYFWTSNSLDSISAIHRFIDANLSAAVWKGPMNKRSGLNIRCVKN